MRLKRLITTRLNDLIIAGTVITLSEIFNEIRKHVAKDFCIADKRNMMVLMKNYNNVLGL